MFICAPSNVSCLLWDMCCANCKQVGRNQWVTCMCIGMWELVGVFLGLHEDESVWYRDTGTSYSPLCPLLFQCPLQLATADKLQLHCLHTGNMQLAPSCHSEDGKS